MSKAKVPWGTYTKMFWEFYKSGDEGRKLEFDSDYEANSAQKSMIKFENRQEIYDVRIIKRRNVLYLERTGMQKKR